MFTNTKSTPIESLRALYPFRVLAYGLRRGSGGAGRFPGGDGIERVIEFDAPTTVSLMGGAPSGAALGPRRGRAGLLRRGWLERSGTAPERLPGKSTFDVRPGDRLRILTSGGGSWERPPDDGDRDVRR